MQVINSETKKLFSNLEDVVYCNHGSYGACPIQVQKWTEELKDGIKNGSIEERDAYNNAVSAAKDFLNLNRMAMNRFYLTHNVTSAFNDIVQYHIGPSSGRIQ